MNEYSVVDRGDLKFYFVTLSERNILFEFQKVVILIEKMS